MQIIVLWAFFPARTGRSGHSWLKVKADQLQAEFMLIAIANGERELAKDFIMPELPAKVFAFVQYWGSQDEIIIHFHD